MACATPVTTPVTPSTVFGNRNMRDTTSFSKLMNYPALLAVALLTFIGVARAENIIFPADAGVIDVTAAPYNADNTGKTDATVAIQTALDDYPARNKIIYLPNGIYLVSAKIDWPKNKEYGWYMKNTILQGQSQAGTIIRLKDNCEGFGDAGKPLHMIWTGGPPAQRFRNSIRNLTLNTGSGNPGAIGISYCASNQGSARELTITAGDDGKQPGVAGLDLTAGEIGPCFVKNVHVIGFDAGVRVRGGINSVTLENIHVEGQYKFGVDNRDQILPILNFTSVNAVTAFSNKGGVAALVNGSITGTGAASSLPAITNDASGIFFVRNLKISGYAESIQNAPGNGPGVATGDITEWASHPPITAFPSIGRSLNLPIKETPQAPWDDLKDWVSVLSFKQPGDKDDTAAIQKAIDSGKPTVYFPNRGQKGLPGSHWAGDKQDAPYVISDTIHIRGKVRRLIGCEGLFKWGGAVPEDKDATPMFRFEDGSEPVVWFERFTFGFDKRPKPMIHSASRTLVMSAVSDVGYSNTGNGDLFLEDVGGGVFTFSNGQHVWARQFNPEVYLKPRFVVDGATAWLFGVKSEPGGPQGLVKNGSQCEVIGAFQYTSHEKQQATGFYTTEDSTATYAAVTEGVWTPKWGVDEPIKETRNGETRTLPKAAVLLHGNGSAMALYSARPATDLGAKPDKPTLAVKSASSKAITLTLAATGTDLAGIKLWRDGIPHRTLPAGDFVDGGLEVGTEHKYKAAAFTFAGAESDPVEVTASTTADTKPPTAPSELRSHKLSRVRHDVAWKGSTDDVGVVDYTISRFTVSDGKPQDKPDLAETVKGSRYADAAVKPGADYLYRITARDAAGNVSQPGELQVTIPTTPPDNNRLIAVLGDERYDFQNKGSWLGDAHTGSWVMFKGEATGGDKPFNIVTIKYGAPDYGEGARLTILADPKVIEDGKKKTLEGGTVLAAARIHSTDGWGKPKAFQYRFDATDAGPHDLYLLVHADQSKGTGSYFDLYEVTLSQGDASQLDAPLDPVGRADPAAVRKPQAAPAAKPAQPTKPTAKPSPAATPATTKVGGDTAAGGSKVGAALIDRANAGDHWGDFGVLQQSPFSSPGKITAVSVFFNQPGGKLRFFLLRPTANPHEFTVVNAMETDADKLTGLQHFSVGTEGWAVQAGDVLAHGAAFGVAWDEGGDEDYYFNLTDGQPSAVGEKLKLEGEGKRTFSIAADFVKAENSPTVKP